MTTSGLGLRETAMHADGGMHYKPTHVDTDIASSIRNRAETGQGGSVFPPYSFHYGSK